MCGSKEFDCIMVEEEYGREATTCETEVLVDASGERFANGDSLVPPAFRTRSSRAAISISDMPSAVSGKAWVSDRLPSSEGGGTCLDQTNAVVKDVAVEAEVYKEEDAEERIDINAGVLEFVAHFGRPSPLPPQGSRRCQPSTSRTPL